MESNRVPYNQEVDHRFLKPIRLLRNKTQTQLGELMDVCPSTVGKLERGDLKFSSRYEKKLRLAIKRLRVSGVELINIRKMLEMKESKGYRS